MVDNDPTLRDLLREILEAEGYNVLLAAEGTAALDLLRSSPHLLVVLLDESLAQWGGKRVLEVVRRDAVLSTRHAYVLTDRAYTHFAAGAGGRADPLDAGDAQTV